MGNKDRPFDPATSLRAGPARGRRIEAALAEIARRTRTRKRPAIDSVPSGLAFSDSEATFRAVVEERLRGLEQQIKEIKGRVNGLLFLLAGTVLTQLVMRLMEG